MEFLLRIPRSLLNAPHHTEGNDTPEGSRGLPPKPAIVGPQPRAGLRRRHPKSKNCANAKKAAANARRRMRRLDKETKETAAKLLEQISILDRKLALMNERELAARQNTQDGAYNVMRVYFNHIARGINPTRFPAQAQATKNYLLSTFSTDLKSPDYTGLDQFVEQWTLLSEYHADTLCRVASIDVYPFTAEDNAGQDDQDGKVVNVVKTHGTTRMQISRSTIERVFPHLLSDETLVQWLIGKTYSLSFILYAYVDGRDGRVFQIESKVDLTSALLDLLQDPFATMKMVEATAMSKHGNLLLTDNVQEDQNVIENGFL